MEELETQIITILMLKPAIQLLLGILAPWVTKKRLERQRAQLAGGEGSAERLRVEKQRHVAHLGRMAARKLTRISRTWHARKAPHTRAPPTRRARCT